MAESKTYRLRQVASKLNVGTSTIADFLQSKGFEVGGNPNAKLTDEQYKILVKQFKDDMELVQEAQERNIGGSHENIVIDSHGQHNKEEEVEEEIRIIDKKSEISGNQNPEQTTPIPQKEESVSEKESITEKTENSPTNKLGGLKVIGKIELDAKGRPVNKKKEVEEEVKKVVEPTPEPVKEKKVIKAEKKVEKVEEVKPKPEVKAPEKKAKEVVKPVVTEKKQPTPETKTKEEKPKQEPVAQTKKTVEPVEKETPVAKVETTPPVKKENPIADTPKDSNLPAEEKDEKGIIQAKATKLQGLTVIGKIELPSKKKPKKVASSADDKDDNGKRKRKRVRKTKGTPITEVKSKDPNTAKSKPASNFKGKKGGKTPKEEVSTEAVDASFKKTMARMSGGGGKSNRFSKSKYRREKRQAGAEAREQQMLDDQEAAKTLTVTEFISTSELAILMEVDVNEVIIKCLGMGMFISINQRLDAEAITVIADEFSFDVEFKSAEEEIDVVLGEEDKDEDLKDRAPIVTIMGHVDHGKTSLLDYIRNAKVAEGEAGGITQHIGAYDVITESDRRIVFLDTPGHEAFTAMRARGAKVTDVVIIVIAADDSVMPQTVEAINHAQVAGVPYVIAFNKVDKPTANPDNIRSQLSGMNILVESWGGKVQEQEISAKTGAGIDELLDLVLLESDILSLKANPAKNAVGTVIEASLDKGKGYMSTVLIEAGTLRVGDTILAGQYHGRVKAMTNSRGKRVNETGPATPVQVLGLNGAPQAGDKFNVLDTEREARDIATKRGQIMREQSIRATKRTTLSDLGRRIALGNFHQLNIILKGDVDGSIEALSDSLQKLSTEEVEVNIIHKAVGPISESDVLLATASDAIVIGFQVRPVPSAKKLADQEEVEIRMYSIIYEAINEVKDAMEGLLSPDVEEVIIGNAEVRDVFRISKVGTVAGCYMTDGIIKRNSKVRIVRDGIVIYGGENGGEIAALKRYKDDMSEVRQGFECGISVKNYNDIKEGDVIEAFEQRETKRKL